MVRITCASPPPSPSFSRPASAQTVSIPLTSLSPLQLDKLVGLAMLVAASVVFLYYSIWTLLMVRRPSRP